ncbi:hypothetical protein [Actinoplanes sp. NPDC020271]|uniref:hypothetical protein n=1 Tax=Actinoplanes sp. NPDC020271 TaxID=3363896 RepID=UPI0037B1EB2A
MNTPTGQVDPRVVGVEVVTRAAVPIVGFRATASLCALRARSSAALRTMSVLLERAGVWPAGPATVILRPNNRPDSFEIMAGYSLPGHALGVDLATDRLPGGLAVQAVHPGSWDTLLGTYDQVGEWLAARHVTEVPLMWEEYLVGPQATEDVHAWRTRVVVPLPGTWPARGNPAGQDGTPVSPGRSTTA